jgi:hypothetical protein
MEVMSQPMDLERRRDIWASVGTVPALVTVAALFAELDLAGYPSRASAEKGRAVVEHLGKAAGDLITLLVETPA